MDWALQIRQRLELEIVEAGHHLLALHRQTGNLEGVCETATQVLGIDPLCEIAFAALMRRA